MSKVSKELLIKTLVFTILTIILMVIIKFSGLFDYIKEISTRVTSGSSRPLNGLEWFSLFGYRLLIYLAIPFIVTVFELIFSKKKRKFAWGVLNFEAHFIALSVVCGVYYLFAFDYILGTKILTIEHSVTSLLLLLFTILLSKKFPHIFIPNENETFKEEKESN